MTTAATKHGRRACYLRGCRLPECVTENFRYTKQLRLDHERGLQRLISAEQAAEHIQKLTEAGWLQAQIARASNVGHSHVRGIANGEHSSISPRTATRLLAVPTGPPPQDCRFVDGTGSSRRVQALIAFGYSAVELAKLLGLAESAVGKIARAERPLVLRTTAVIISVRYRRLSRIPGPDNRARIIARRKGWHGPLAWDEQTIDDPNALPDLDDGIPNQRDGLKRLDVEHLLRCGISTEEVKARTGASIAYIREIAAELAGRPRIRKAVAA